MIPNLGQVYSSPIVQYGAAATLAIAILGTMFLFGYQTLFGRAVPGWEETFLVAAMTLSANILGYHQGAVQTSQATTRSAEVTANATANVVKEVVSGQTTNGTHYS